MEIIISILVSYGVQLPVIIVYLVGIGLSIAYWNRHPRVSLLALTAFVLLLLVLLVSVPVSRLLIPVILERGGTYISVSAFFTGTGIVYSMLQLAAFVLLLIAIFSGRSKSPVRG